ncbi:lysine decarboxylase, putative [Eimeria maxima]|uniref:Lysine decarboxylase, putative n=1 Tax=Eimeria maxima TaxID=5804 RepID=U6M9A5_EIMMA|nr:lysine decarboxylase, putative [Eimeria maxima]CDJ59044.1 lysine decarboxylase, putative [Eimeria maxima]
MNIKTLEEVWLSDDEFVLDPTRITLYTGKSGLDGETFKELEMRRLLSSRIELEEINKQIELIVKDYPSLPDFSYFHPVFSITPYILQQQQQQQYIHLLTIIQKKQQQQQQQQQQRGGGGRGGGKEKKEDDDDDEDEDEDEEEEEEKEKEKKKEKEEEKGRGRGKHIQKGDLSPVSTPTSIDGISTQQQQQQHHNNQQQQQQQQQQQEEEEEKEEKEEGEEGGGEEEEEEEEDINKYIKDGDIREPFYLSYDEENVIYYKLNKAIKLIKQNIILVATTFIIPYPPGFPIAVPGQVST